MTPKQKTQNRNKSDKPYLFKPGQSGNPGGRPAIPKEVKEAFQAHTMTALKVLINILNAKTSKPMEKLKAAEIILDRALGKPTQPITGDGEGGPIFKIIIEEKEMK